MKKLITAAALTVAAVGLGSSPASADAPIEFPDSLEFPDTDPCSGDPMFVTIDLDIKAHLGHPKNNVFIIDFDPSTDTGYTSGGAGREIVVVAENFIVDVSTDMLTNAEGDRVKVNFRLVVNPNGVAVETLDLRCVRDA